MSALPRRVLCHLFSRPTAEDFWAGSPYDEDGPANRDPAEFTCYRCKSDRRCRVVYLNADYTPLPQGREHDFVLPDTAHELTSYLSVSVCAPCADETGVERRVVCEDVRGVDADNGYDVHADHLVDLACEAAALACANCGTPRGCRVVAVPANLPTWSYRRRDKGSWAPDLCYASLCEACASYVNEGEDGGYNEEGEGLSLVKTRIETNRQRSASLELLRHQSQKLGQPLPLELTEHIFQQYLDVRAEPRKQPYLGYIKATARGAKMRWIEQARAAWERERSRARQAAAF